MTADRSRPANGHPAAAPAEEALPEGHPEEALPAADTFDPSAASIQPPPPAAETGELATEELPEAVRKLQAALHDLHLEQAAFRTYRERMDQEKADIRKYGAQQFAFDLLRVVDYFRMSLAFELPADLPPAVTGVLEGVRFTITEFERVLEQHGIRPIDTSGGFDAACMEAVAARVEPGIAQGTVLSVEQPGYWYHDRVLRPARVVVAVESDAGEGDEQAASEG